MVIKDRPFLLRELSSAIMDLCKALLMALGLGNREGWNPPLGAFLPNGPNGS